MIEIRFPADRPDIARVFARALAELGGDPVPSKHAEAEPPPCPPEGAPTEPDNRFDENGVPKNPDLCGDSSDPFYGEGNPRAGQWKKRRNVSWDDYDAWYASARPLPDNAEPAGGSPFAAQPIQDNTPAPDPLQDCPITTGAELMRWISEQQADGHLPDDLQFVWQDTGVTVADLFADENPGAVSEAVNRVYARLMPICS